MTKGGFKKRGSEKEDVWTMRLAVRDSETVGRKEECVDLV
jgi:hypothetical protein